ncbi:hypothetical protein M8C13_03740 [Crossiella sp. SN42]|uniref:hypothetical protein n=1 Tax=Crossiella sp. SN42 TaxID=2944808 RepID=UPI00207C793B|nr:hypothetical protein [Crossiella sp. SN42]MCO1574871.1 hypothetical protein [Crossiella sp. SN42]
MGPTPEQSAAEREQVRDTAMRAWGEPVRVFRPSTPRWRYYVRGRRRDGTPKPPRNRSGCLGIGLSGLLDLPGLVGEALAEGVFALLFWPMRDTVRGEEGSGGVRFADAVRRGGAWLVWSPSRVGLVDGNQQLVWTAAGPERPELRLPRRLRWPDGSWVRLAALQHDRKRYREEEAGLAR